MTSERRVSGWILWERPRSSRSAGSWALASSPGPLPLCSWSTRPGNPLYCVALLQELGAGQLDRVHGPLRVPRDLASLLLARVSRLQPAAQALVMAAAVLGQRSPLRLAGELAGIDDPQVAVEQAAGASVLAEVPGELGDDISFVHPLVRSAVYYDLGAARRTVLHRRAAGLLGGERSLAHRVAAAAGPDEALAVDLEEAARAARGSGRRMLAASLFAQAATASAEAGPGSAGCSTRSRPTWPEATW